MKTTKSPEHTDDTPSKKKLKQARLPFKLISDGSPTPVPPQTRKRKLSTPNPEPVTKIGKISKENDLTDELVVISDDDCKSEQESPKEGKTFNPYVKIVDIVLKKKLQKSKKKKVTNKKDSNESKVSLGSVRSDTNLNKTVEDEPMEVDITQKDDDVATNVKEKGSNTNNDKSNSDKVSCSNSNESPVLSQNNIDSSDIEKSKLDNETDFNDSKVNSNLNGIIKPLEEMENDDSSETSAKTNSHVPNKELNNKKSEKDEEESQEKPEVVNVLTPKRSTRNKTQKDDSDKSNSSKLNDSTLSNPTTPKHSRTSSANSHGNESLNESATNLTPKQLQKRLESAKKKEEKEKERLEREKKKQQEKDEKAKLRQEKEDQKKKEREEKEEAKRKEKEEKEEQRRKEKEEKEKQKELERKLKEEKEDQKRKEKEEKEEQRRKEKEAREEEKRKRQEALDLEKQEQELKKKKASEAFVNFFVPKQKVEKDQTVVGPISKSSVLSSFTIKADMRLAPTVRVNLDDDKRQNLDNLLERQDAGQKVLYLNELQEGSWKPQSNDKTWPLDDKDEDDVMIIEDELPPLGVAGEAITCESAVREKLRPKLLSFHENRRPPYWGTWRKKSNSVKPRRPFGQDQKQLDYEVDSDDDWEEEQEGESIDGSAAGSDDEQDADEYEVDNEVFVPHGYLSDEEATMDEDDVLSLSPDAQQARLKHLEDEFESEMKKPTEKLKPRLYGLLWETSDGGKPEHCVDALWNYFGKLAMIMNDPTPFLQPSNEPEESEKKKVKKKKVLQEQENKSPKSEKKKKDKEPKPKGDTKNNTPEIKKNQPGINSFLKKIKS